MNCPVGSLNLSIFPTVLEAVWRRAGEGAALSMLLFPFGVLFLGVALVISGWERSFASKAD